MPKKIAFFIFLFVFFMCNSVRAQLSPDQEERLRDLEKKEEVLDAWEKNRSEMEETLEDLRSSETALKGRRQGEKDKKTDLTEERTGRYQAVRMDNNAVFILDTKEGHIWVWVIQKDNKGKPAEFLFYQGKVIPGSKMGELIDRTYQK